MTVLRGTLLLGLLTSLLNGENPTEERPVGFQLNYESGEKNTYGYTANGCRILGKLFLPDTTQPQQKEKHPMAEMPVLDEYRMKKGNHTTVVKKVKPHKNKEPKKQQATPVLQSADFDPAQVVPAGADTSKPTTTLALQAQVYAKDLTILSWSHEGERYQLAVNRNLAHLSSITAYESPSTTYLFFYLPEDLRKNESAQRNKPEVPAWGGKKGLQTYLLAGDKNDAAAMDGVEALLDIHKTHKKVLKDIYREFKKRQKELANRPKPKASEPTISEVFYYRSN